MPAEKVSPQQQALLSSLWVESVEEFTAMMAAMESAEASSDSAVVNPLRQSESAILDGVPEEALAPWRAATAGGALGCAIDPDILEMFGRQGRISLPGAVTAQLSDAPLPPSVRLMDKLFPVRDQGGRGTCVAFASVGLREYLAGCSVELSEQFLYWACKQLDGHLDEVGTFVHTAMSALGTMGVCPGEIWPYDPEPIPGDESQGPPPDEAKEQAAGFVMLNSRTVAPNCVNHYKLVLAGTDGLGGMPVVIASLVFNSWFRSAATHQTGKITMPLPGEQPLGGGHAMLIVGYQDDSSVPGGGYFIVRNSWGDRWAAASPETKGHALMPYAYVERYVAEAFSGQTTAADPNHDESLAMETVVSAGGPAAFEQRYVTTLRRETRDVEGKLLKAGTRVIRHPNVASEVMADTPANRDRFRKQHHAWSDRARQAAWFPPRSQWDESLRTSLTRAHQQCREFLSATDDNISSAAGRPLPDIHLPLWRYGLASIPKAKEARKVADLTEQFAREVCARGSLPAGIEPPDEWMGTLMGICRMQVYSVAGRAGRFHVVSAFATPLCFRAGAVPEVETSCPVILDIVERLYRDWAASQASVRFTFFTVGSATGWTDGMKGSAGGRAWTLLSWPDGSDRWQTSAPAHFASRLSLRNFLERLYPETRQQQVSRVKSIVDGYIKGDYDAGHILLEKVVRQTGYRRTVIRGAFSAMQDSGHYKCYRVEDQIAIGKASARSKGIRLQPVTPAVVKYHLAVLLSVLVPLLGWRVASYYETGHYRWWALWIVLPFAYIGLCMEIALKRRQSDL